MSARRAEQWWFPASVCAVALLVYANTLSNGFVWDDDNLIVGNPLIKQWTEVGRLFTVPLERNTLYYRPLQALLFSFDYRLFGLSPAAFHLTSALLHALVGMLLYRVADRLLGDPLAALGAALLFVVHPVHTEAVAYASGSADPLAAVFLLASMLWFLTPRRRAWSLGAFFLALLSRESAMTLVLLIGLADVTDSLRRGEALRGSLGRRALRSYAPYVGVLGAYLVLRYAAVGGDATTHDTMSLSLGTRLLTMTTVVARYLGLLVFPRTLHMERLVPPASSIFDPAVLGALALLVCLSVAAVAGRRRAWPFSFGWAWFALALLPVANVMPLSTFMAEHWLYVPSMGLFIAAGWGVARLAERIGRPAAMALLVLLVVGYGARTAYRNRDWRDARTIFEATLRLAPHSARAHMNLGRAHSMAGERDAALQEFARAIALRPDHWQTADAHSHRGIIYAQSNRPHEAVAEFERAIQLDPRDASLYVNLSIVLQGLGRADDAQRALDTALDLDPDSAIAHSNLGNVYYHAGDLARARTQYLRAIALAPELADAHNNLGSVYLAEGRADLAVQSFRTALQLDPTSTATRASLAVAMRAQAGAIR